jgi:membrane-bound lytic murein transglycosylase D
MNKYLPLLLIIAAITLLWIIPSAARADLFTSEESLQGPSLKSSTTPSPKKHSKKTKRYKKVPIVINAEVEKHIKYFQTKKRKNFKTWLERSASYRPMIKRILKEKGMPEDLIYLAMIESGFNTKARSRARAVGMWQFISGTGKRYDLEINWWIDERRNPEKATISAANYLEDLYIRFDSWYLAAAGYNAGEGRVARAIKRYKTDDFWVLASKKYAFKRETRDYVPKFLAAMVIAKNPRKYGFTNLKYQKPAKFELVNIPTATDLKVIASAADTSVGMIRRINPELLRWYTPPNMPEYMIRIPKGKAKIFAENFELIPTKDRLKFHTHRVAEGETLWDISRRYRTSMRQIKYLNNLRSSRLIRAGSTLVIPLREGTKIRDIKRPTRTKTASVKIPAGAKTYTVRKGDTLWDISMRFGIGVNELLKLNNLRRSRPIHPGQMLLI